MTRRIVSLVPSLTDTVCAIGLEAQLAGCTNFCVSPPGLHRKTQLIGGTKDPDLDRIKALAPTHILVNEEENKPEHIARCLEIAPTLCTFPQTFADGVDMIRELGRFLGAEISAEILADRIGALHTIVSHNRAGRTNLTNAIYLIWREPYMTVARNTYISAMLDLMGIENLIEGETRYPEIAADTMRELSPDFILLSTEPYPFRLRDAVRLQEELGEVKAKVCRIDGQLMSWYGAKQLEAIEQIDQWLRLGSCSMMKQFEV